MEVYNDYVESVSVIWKYITIMWRALALYGSI